MTISVWFWPPSGQTARSTSIVLFNGNFAVPDWSTPTIWPFSPTIGFSSPIILASGTPGLAAAVAGAANDLWTVAYDGRFWYQPATGSPSLVTTLPSGKVYIGTAFVSGEAFAAAGDGTVYTSGGTLLGSWPTGANALAGSGNVMFSILPASGIGTITAGGVTGLVTFPSGITEPTCLTAAAGSPVVLGGWTPTAPLSGVNAAASFPQDPTAVLGVASGYALLWNSPALYSDAWTQTQMLSGLANLVSVAWQPDGSQALACDPVSGVVQVLGYAGGVISLLQTLALSGAAYVAVVPGGQAVVLQPALSTATNLILSGGVWVSGAVLTSRSGMTGISVYDTSGIVFSYASGVHYDFYASGIWNLLGDLTLGFAPTCVVADPYANVYVAGSGQLAAVEHSPAGFFVWGSGVWSGGLASSILWNQGRLIIATPDDSELRVFGHPYPYVTGPGLWTQYGYQPLASGAPVNLGLAASTLFVSNSGNTTLYGFSGTPFALTPVMSGAVGFWDGSAWHLTSLGAGNTPSALTLDAAGNTYVSTIQNTYFVISSTGTVSLSGIVEQQTSQLQTVPIGLSSVAVSGTSLYFATSIPGALVEVLGVAPPFVPVPPSGAPTGSPQYPTLFDRYPVRPHFAVPGVDYRAGINTGVVLQDWRTITASGAVLGANSVAFNGVSNITLDGYDFSYNQGAFLSFENCSNILVQNCYFGGPHLVRNPAGVITADAATSGITVQYCEIDQGGIFLIPISSISQSSSAIVITTVPHGLTGAFNQIQFVGCQGMTELNTQTVYTVTVVDVLTLEVPVDTSTFSAYTGGGSIQIGGAAAILLGNCSPLNLYFNWIYHMPTRPLTAGTVVGPTSAINYKYNLVEQGAYAFYAHLNFQEIPGIGTTVDIDWEYNLIRQTIEAAAGGEGPQFSMFGGGILPSPVVASNVIVSTSSYPYNYLSFPHFSYLFHGADPNPGTGYGAPSILTGVGTFSNNYVDFTSAYGWVYPGTFDATNGWTDSAGNTDLVTGQTITQDGSTVLTFQAIAPVVAGGTSYFNFMIANGGVGYITTVLDGLTVSNYVNSTVICGGSGSEETSVVSIAFATPGTIGAHVISVYVDSASLVDIPFNVISSSDFYISVNTPASDVYEGSPITISGTYFNGTPSIFFYAFNGLNKTIASSPIVAGGSFSFTVPAPPAINPNNNIGYGGFTVTVTAYGPGTASTISLPFTVAIAPSLGILKPFSDYASLTQDLVISGEYGGPAPSSLTYSVDGGISTAAPSPIIAGGNWQFTIITPGPAGVHTITVTGVGANTASVTSPPFRSSPQIFAPGPPGVPTSIFTAPGLIAIEWTAPVSGSPPTSYEVDYALHGSGIWNVWSAGTAQTTDVISGLTLGATYDVRVSASNLGGTSAFATNSAGIPTPATFADGAAGAPAGVSPQLPTLLNGYPARPPWNVAGVDYGVGYPSGTTFTDWTTLSGTGITVGANYVEYNGLTAPVIDSIDFSTGGGAYLLFANCTSPSVTNCLFGGTWSGNGCINTDLNSSDLTVTNCIFNAGPAAGEGCIWALAGGTTIVEYCLSYLPHVPLLTLGNYGGTLSMQFNVVEGDILINSQNAVSYVTLPVISYNTVSTASVTPGTFTDPGIYFGDNLGTTGDSTVSNNVLVAAIANTQNFWISVGATTGTAVMYYNWIDSTGAYGPFYGSVGTFTNWIVLANTDLPTDTPLPEQL